MHNFELDTANDADVKLDEDGWPEIESWEDLSNRVIEPEDDGNPFEACPECRGELAEPCEVEEH